MFNCSNVQTKMFKGERATLTKIMNAPTANLETPLPPFVIHISPYFHNSLIFILIFLDINHISLVCHSYFPPLSFLSLSIVNHISLINLSYFPRLSFIFPRFVIHISLVLFLSPSIIIHISLDYHSYLFQLSIIFPPSIIHISLVFMHIFRKFLFGGHMKIG